MTSEMGLRWIGNCCLARCHLAWDLACQGQPADQGRLFRVQTARSYLLSCL